MTPPPPAPSAAPGSASPALPPLRILLAEDNLVNQRVATLVLTRLGQPPAKIVGDGVEALAAVSAQPFDIILLDVQMPRLSGLDTATALRRTPPPGGCPWIIALTANALEGDREICLAAGMDDYLTKPITAAVLSRAIHHANTQLACRTHANPPRHPSNPL